MRGLVHVAGNAVVDLILHGRGGGEGSATDGWGDNVEILQEPVDVALGGCGAGPAYVLGRLGQPVALTANLGDDGFGQLLAGWLTRAGVRLAAPPAPGTATAVHIIRVDGGRRRSSYWRGTRVRWAEGLAPDDTAWYLAAGHGAVEASDVDALGGLCRSLRAKGVKVLFDPGPWFAGRVPPPAMARLWRQVDVLSATEEELAHWVPGGHQGVDLARACLALGPVLVAAKCGCRGAAWATADGAGHVPARSAEGNSVGAGDTFNARLAFGLCRGEPPATAVAEAVSLATRVVEVGRGVLGLFAVPDTGPTGAQRETDQRREA